MKKHSNSPKLILLSREHMRLEKKSMRSYEEQNLSELTMAETYLRRKLLAVQRAREKLLLHQRGA